MAIRLTLKQAALIAATGGLNFPENSDVLPRDYWAGLRVLMNAAPHVYDVDLPEARTTGHHGWYIEAGDALYALEKANVSTDKFKAWLRPSTSQDPPVSERERLSRSRLIGMLFRIACRDGGVRFKSQATLVEHLVTACEGIDGFSEYGLRDWSRINRRKDNSTVLARPWLMDVPASR